MKESICIKEYIQGVSQTDFFQDRARQGTVCMRLLVIGEAASYLRNDFEFENNIRTLTGLPWPVYAILSLMTMTLLIWN